MFMTTMNHYYHRKGNKIIVQNMVGSYEGQLHEHTLKDFEQWKKGIDPKCLINLDKQ